VRISIGILLAAILLTSTVPTWAQTATLAAVSGKPVKLIFYTDSINPDCSVSGTTTIRVTQAPQHGTARIAKTSEFPNFVAANIRSRCNLRRVGGSTAVYTSQRGYVGSDSVSLEIISSRGGLVKRNYFINVR
jgi:hypothetical protein